MLIYPIEEIQDQGSKAKNKSLRLRREAHWIRELNTMFPNGMNRKLINIHDICFSLPFNSWPIH